MLLVRVLAVATLSRRVFSNTRDGFWVVKIHLLFGFCSSGRVELLAIFFRDFDFDSCLVFISALISCKGENSKILNELVYISDLFLWYLQLKNNIDLHLWQNTLNCLNSWFSLTSLLRLRFLADLTLHIMVKHLPPILQIVLFKIIILENNRSICQILVSCWLSSNRHI